MCGIGIVLDPGCGVSRRGMRRMTDAMLHRGPCANAVHVLPSGVVGLAHTRLSLVDLSERANQPLLAAEDALVFNGEIYNYVELRSELEKSGCTFFTTSDSEVLLQGLRTHGVEFMRKAQGCFAFGYYDSRQQRLYVARDPMGEKQLVYTRKSDGQWLFASEVKALSSYQNERARIDRVRVYSDLVFNFFSDRTSTYFEGVYHFTPGLCMVFDLRAPARAPQSLMLWEPPHPADENADSAEIAAEIDHLMQLAVRQQVRLDAEIVSILSGGLDSSYVTALAVEERQCAGRQPLEALTIRYQQGANEDLAYARLLSEVKGFRLHEVAVDRLSSSERIETVTRSVEEPLLDKVYLAQWANYAAAARCSRAALNGQGADELWTGYLHHYAFVRRFQHERSTADSFRAFWAAAIPPLVRPSIKRVLLDIIEQNFEHNMRPHVHLDGPCAVTRFSLATHLRAMITHEDRLSMANGVEVRLPHLDQRLFELAHRTPGRIKVHGEIEKHLLKRAALARVPSAITSRRKKAFPDAPTEQYLATLAMLSPEDGRGADGELFREIFEDSALGSLDIRLRWTRAALNTFERVFA